MAAPSCNLAPVAPVESALSLHMKKEQFMLAGIKMIIQAAFVEIKQYLYTVWDYDSIS